MPLLVGFVVVTVVMDLVMTGAIPKWAIFAPIFVPLFMRLGTRRRPCSPRIGWAIRRSTRSRR